MTPEQIQAIFTAAIPMLADTVVVEPQEGNVIWVEFTTPRFEMPLVITQWFNAKLQLSSSKQKGTWHLLSLTPRTTGIALQTSDEVVLNA